MTSRFILLPLLAAGALLLGCGTAGGNGRELNAPVARVANCPAPDGLGGNQLSRDRSFH
jgi:hypothetical protein